MRIGVVGPGSIGILFSTLLRHAGADVLVLDRDPNRARRLTEGGLTRIWGETHHRAMVRVCVDHEILRDSDMIILATKAYDAESASQQIKGWVRVATPVLTVQNGLGVHELVAGTLRQAAVLPAITPHGATLVREGIVRHMGEGIGSVGALKEKDQELAKEVARLLREHGLPFNFTGNIALEIWKKLLANSVINPLTAMTGLRNGSILERDELRALIEPILSEGVTVARARDMQLDLSLVLRYTKSLIQATKDNRSSMLQDIERGKRTEVEWINGGIVKEGRRLGLRTPINEALTDLVNREERGALTRGEQAVSHMHSCVTLLDGEAK